MDIDDNQKSYIYFNIYVPTNKNMRKIRNEKRNNNDQ